MIASLEKEFVWFFILKWKNFREELINEKESIKKVLDKYTLHQMNLQNEERKKLAAEAEKHQLAEIAYRQRKEAEERQKQAEASQVGQAKMVRLIKATYLLFSMSNGRPNFKLRIRCRFLLIFLMLFQPNHQLRGQSLKQYGFYDFL